MQTLQPYLKKTHTAGSVLFQCTDAALRKPTHHVDTHTYQTQHKAKAICSGDSHIFQRRMHTVCCTSMHWQEPAYLLNVQLVRVSSGILGELLPVTWQNIELRNDIKEAAAHALCPSQIGVQLVLAPQLPCPRKVICLKIKLLM